MAKYFSLCHSREKLSYWVGGIWGVNQCWKIFVFLFLSFPTSSFSLLFSICHSVFEINKNKTTWKKKLPVRLLRNQLPGIFLKSSPVILSPQLCASPDNLVSSMLLQYVRHVPTSGLLHLAFPADYNIFSSNTILRLLSELLWPKLPWQRILCQCSLWPRQEGKLTWISPSPYF